MSSKELDLYHGTTREAAERLLAEGWRPGAGAIGGNCGQTRYLYLTNGYENALWFAQEKGDEVVLQVRAPVEALQVDPEDGVRDSVEEELSWQSNLPGNVVLTRPLGPEAFRVATLTPCPVR